MKFLKSFFSPFTIMGEGYYRLIFAGQFIIPIVAAVLAVIMSPDPVTTGFYPHSYEDEYFFTTLLVSIPLYYVIARIGLWIYVGFKK